MFIRKYFLYLINLSVFSFVFAGMNCIFNYTEFSHHRKARALIYEGGGTLKLVIGPTLPLNFGDPITWRSVIISYNLHGGHYTLPTTPLYPWEKWEELFARSMKNSNNGFDESMEYAGDDTRYFVYLALEKYLGLQNGNGRSCLLRSICENAQVHQHLGILSEILNIVLTPGREKMSTIYKDAYELGASGIDCIQKYSDCPKGENILERFVDFL